MWILFQILGCLGVIVTNSIGRAYGFSNFVAAGFAAALYFGGWICFNLSYSKAPSFADAYVLGSCALAILTAVVGLVFFKESISLIKAIGFVALIIGSLLVSRG